MSATWGGSSGRDPRRLADELSRALEEATTTAREQLAEGPDGDAVANLLEAADRLEMTTQALADRVRQIRDEHSDGW